MRFTRLSVFACVLAFLAVGAQAQGVGSSGELTGIVYDPSGAVVTKATVTATSPDKGIKRTGETDSHGRFRVSGLQPGTYNVTVQTTGFQMEARNVTVAVGEIATLDLHLKVAGVKGQVEVTTADVPVVETERGHQSNTISQAYINELPIDRRDYLTFTLLTPGVSDSSRLAGDQNFRVKQTPQSNLSFYGNNGRGNNITVDGGEANDDAGGVRLTMSQDAIQEFQINRSNYSAEMGSASGAAINIVSKSGSNKMHGTVYGFFRDSALDSRDPFAFKSALPPGTAFDPTQPDSFGAAVKNDLSRQQFGGTLGFPLKKDKSFLFLAFEGLTEDSHQSVPVLQNTGVFRIPSTKFNDQQSIIDGLAALGATPVPCLTGQPALPAATCAGILTNVLTINSATSPRNAFLVNQFEGNGGVFPFPTHQYLASARFDHRFSDKDQVNLRYSFGSDIEHNPDLQSLTGLSRGSSIKSYDDTLQGSYFHQFSGFTQNEVRAQFNYYNLDIVPNTPGQVGLDMPGFLNMGTNIFQPADTISHRWEFADNMTVIRGRHTMKFGASELLRQTHADSHTFFPGRFVFGNLPGGVLSPCLQVPAACGLFNTNPAFINPLQNASLGLPLFYEQGFGDASVGGSVYRYSRPLTSLYWQDAWAVRPNFTLNFGLRYELDSQTAALNTDKDNFAPRVSIAWDPFSDHKTVVRAGYGIYHSNVYGQIADVVHTLGEGAVNGSTQIANLLIPLQGLGPLTSAAVFQTLFAQGKVQCTIPTPGTDACITPGDLAQFGINITHSGTLPLPVFFRGQPGYQNPYSQQASIGIEREIASGFTVSGSYVYVHTLHLPVAVDTNLLPGAPDTTVILANGGQFTYKNWGTSQCTTIDPASCFVDHTILQNNVYASGGSALYQGALFEVKKRFNNNFTLMGNYTFSKAEDTNTDFNSDFGPQDNTNLKLDHALSEFDQRHKLVIAAIVESPWKAGKDATTSEKIFGGFELSPILRYNSGHPFNLLTIQDINGDRHYTNDRPIGAGRNTGQGPDYLAFDMRLSRGFKLGESGNLKFLIEAFNLFNRTNYAAVNNYVPANVGLPTTSGGLGLTSFHVSGTKGDPHDPLAFTSAFPRQEFQLGLRYSF